MGIFSYVYSPYQNHLFFPSFQQLNPLIKLFHCLFKDSKLLRLVDSFQSAQRRRTRTSTKGGESTDIKFYWVDWKMIRIPRYQEREGVFSKHHFFYGLIPRKLFKLLSPNDHC
ncbi:hypothetical protein WN943_024693 [Citrus x changshan-huyou]